MSRNRLTISLTLVLLYRTLWAMSRKNRSKFIASRLNNNQTCKAVFVQYDEQIARQIDAHQPQTAASATAWTAPALPRPRPSTQPQRIAGQHQRTAEERQHPRERTEGDSSTKAQRQNPGEGEDARQGKDSAQRLHSGETAPSPSQQEDRGQPATPSRYNPPARQTPAPPRGCRRGQRNGRREGERERPENDSKRAPPSRCPRHSHRPGAPPMPSAVPAYKDRGQPRRAPEDRGSNSAFVEYAEPPLTNAAHAIPGEARQGGYFTF